MHILRNSQNDSAPSPLPSLVQSNCFLLLTEARTESEMSAGLATLSALRSDARRAVVVVRDKAATKGWDLCRWQGFEVKLFYFREGTSGEFFKCIP